MQALKLVPNMNHYNFIGLASTHDTRYQSMESASDIPAQQSKNINLSSEPEFIEEHRIVGVE